MSVITNDICRVELLAAYGSDLDVVNAARVSFNKESEWEVFRSFNPDYNGGLGGWDYIPTFNLKEADKKLIAYLAKHNHFTPFTHCFLKFRITVPVPIARQLMKSTVGLSVNEESRRYVSYTPEVHLPTKWRKKAANKKQGSMDEEAEFPEEVQEDYKIAVEMCVDLYEDLIKRGVCEEQARFVLPQGAMVSFIWSGTLYAFARVCKLRCAKDAQYETQQVANRIKSALTSSFPVSTSALLDGG